MFTAVHGCLLFKSTPHSYVCLVSPPQKKKKKRKEKKKSADSNEKYMGNVMCMKFDGVCIVLQVHVHIYYTLYIFIVDPSVICSDGCIMCIFLLCVSHIVCVQTVFPILKLRRFNCKTHDFHSFSYFGPHIWNNLPQGVRPSNSLPSFENKLRTFLFSEHFN